MSGIAKTKEGMVVIPVDDELSLTNFIDYCTNTLSGPQGGVKDTSENEHHGTDATTGMGGSTTGASAPSEENQAHGTLFFH